MSNQQEQQSVELPHWLLKWRALHEDFTARHEPAEEAAKTEEAAAAAEAPVHEEAPVAAPQAAESPVAIAVAPKAEPQPTAPAPVVAPAAVAVRETAPVAPKEVKSLRVQPKVGQLMEDGTIYAGKSPTTGKALYAAPADASLCMSFRKAAKYARKLEIDGNKDFRLPTKEELKLLYKARSKGAFNGTFKTEDEEKSGWYWSSTTSAFPFMMSSRRFYSGMPFPTFKLNRASVRCVR